MNFHGAETLINVTYLFPRGKFKYIVEILEKEKTLRFSAVAIFTIFHIFYPLFNLKFRECIFDTINNKELE